MLEMAQVERIRWMLHVEGKSQRQVAKELRISRHTVAKYAHRPEVPKYTRTKPRTASVLTPEFQSEIERLLAENDLLPRKQRWIGQTIFLALQEQGYQGSEPTVRRHIAQVRKDRRKRTAYVPLEFEPGEVAEFDWGEAEVTLANQRIKVQLLCVRLRWSGMVFVTAYPHQRQEAMFDGLRRAFEALGGVPLRLTSDNLKQAVQKILEGKNRKEQDAYRSFRTHYLFDSNFCNPASGNEKGSVENLVGYAQRNIIGPRLEAKSWDELQSVLWERCLKYAERTRRGDERPILQRWQHERGLLRPLPKHPYPCCRILPVTSNGVACVQFETCRYSVPVRYAYQELTLWAYWDRVEIYHGMERVASHPRRYEREQDVFDLDHYLDVLWRKPGALAQAKPFRAANLPAAYHQFRAELLRRDARGDREFCRLLMLHREFPPEDVQDAVERALEQRAIHVETVRQILLERCRPADGSPVALAARLSAIRVQQPALTRYDALVKRGVVH